MVALDTTQNLLEKIKTKKIIFKLNKNVDPNIFVDPFIKVSSKNENEIAVSYEKNNITYE